MAYLPATAYLVQQNKLAISQFLGDDLSGEYHADAGNVHGAVQN